MHTLTDAQRDDLALLGIGQLEDNEARRTVVLALHGCQTFTDVQRVAELVARGGYAIPCPYPDRHLRQFDLAWRLGMDDGYRPRVAYDLHAVAKVVTGKSKGWIKLSEAQRFYLENGMLAFLTFCLAAFVILADVASARAEDHQGPAAYTSRGLAGYSHEDRQSLAKLIADTWSDQCVIVTPCSTEVDADQTPEGQPTPGWIGDDLTTSIASAK